MTTTKLRWGILGVAGINQRLLPGFAKAANAELRGIASRALDKAQAAAKAAGIPQAYGSYEALLDDPNIDAVYNPLPNTLHAEWTRKAAERGKHVLCEKPLTPTAAEAQELVAFCAARKICLMDGFMWPHHPRTAALKKFLSEGKIGAVRRVAGCFTFQMEPLDPANIRLQAPLGGGSLLDVGCYPVYGIRWAMGAEPVRAWAAAHYVNGCDVEMSGTLWFADGRLATFDCGFTHPFRQWLEITGSAGVVHVHDMWLPPRRAVFEVRRGGSYDAEVCAVEGYDQIQRMLENFGRYVLDGQPVTPPPSEAVKTLKVLDGLAASARSGYPVVVV
ncbi:MAG: Gfo/Idh/MocA family oxidoreductase [Gemmataceae bacterium]|nr:Gfo/Idh/MocA family oxidoreductase [Gemmataceae bacterium]